jgi:hypothetical protein
MKAASQHPPLIGDYYFQCRTQGHARYIVSIFLGRWERWRGDWALMQADVHDLLTLPVAAPTLDRAKWVKDPGLESGFDPVLDQIWYLAKNSLTLLMVLHDFMSKRLTPLQDQPRPALMYTRVNDIMQLDRRPGSSLDEDLLAASLKALTTDRFLAELMVSLAACEPICMNQAMRTALLAAMSTLDDVDIALVQRGDLSHGVVIHGDGVLGGAAGGRGQGGGPAGVRGGSSADDRGGPVGGGPAGGQGGDPTGGFSPALAPVKGKDKHVWVVLDDDEVSSDEDAPLQKQLRLSSTVGGSSGSAPARPMWRQ